MLKSSSKVTYRLSDSFAVSNTLVEADSTTWGALADACKTQCNLSVIGMWIRIEYEHIYSYILRILEQIFVFATLFSLFIFLTIYIDKQWNTFDTLILQMCTCKINKELFFSVLRLIK